MSVEFRGEAETMVILRKGEASVPVSGDERVAFDVDAFGFGLLTHAWEG